MADKPLYYGGKGSPMYYGSAQGSYGARSPMYYGASKSYGQYGSYGSYGSYGGVPHDDGTVIGALTFGRILRVVAQRWLSVFVFLLIGLIVSFAIYSISPTIYEAKSEFTMDIRRNNGRGNTAIEQAMVNYGDNYAEIFNTRLTQWRSEAIIKKITDAYRNKFPTSTVSDAELISCLAGSQLELQRNSRIITIAVRSKVPETAMALANAYAQAIEDFSDEENKAKCDKAVSHIHSQVEKTRREKDQLDKDILEFSSVNKVDAMRSQRDMTNQALQKTTADILALETQEAQLVEWEKLLTAVQKDPSRFGSLAANVPRAQEIASEYAAFQKITGEYQALLVNFTDEHPDVIAKSNELENAKSRFLDATARAHETGSSTLAVAKNQLASLRGKQAQLQAELTSVGQRIAVAESSLRTMESEYNMASRVFESLILEEQKARMEAEANNEIINVGRPASLPSRPVLPNPLVIFGVGVFLSLALGFVFVLVLDNLEDTVVNLSDIEGRLALKVLAVLPHVRRKKREHVAKFTVEDKYSQFSEAVAGLRNLLDSPRYESMSHCMLVISTQPGEGKTITSTSMAISYAQAGRKVLHVDFDLRRPRLARIWDIELTKEKSFSHALQAAGGKIPDFASLVSKSSVEGLDVICSLPPEGISPSQIFGSTVIADFFAWARANYDRVIVDSPPYGLVGDVVSLSVLVDSVIIMCCPDRTHFKPIQHCSRSLTEAGANILGVVVNDVEISNTSAFSPASHHRYGYGYGYGGYGYAGYTPSRRGRGDGDNPTSEVAKQDAEKAGESAPPSPAIHDDELADEE